MLELSILVLLNPQHPHEVIGSLLAFRLIYYYLAPLAVALLLLGGRELTLHREQAKGVVGLAGRWTPAIAPRLLAFSVFLAGAILLFSGAAPAAEGRMHLLRRFLPLPIVEMSHFLGSVTGALLLLLARSLQRRIDSAYWLSVLLLGAGAVFSLLKGFDYEEAVILGGMLAVLLPCRRHFHRRGALWSERFTPSWMIAVISMLACSGWLMLFAYKHVEYAHDLWWRFAFHGNAPRSLRAVTGAVLAVLVYFSARLLRPKPRLVALPAADEREAARSIVRRSPQTYAHLALLGDKRFLFNKNKTAMIMYGVEGRSWVAMGDPVGDEEAGAELAWDFRELCDEGGAWSVFYQVSDDRLSLYVDMGLTLIKLGEEARVPLPSFALEGGARKGLRKVNKHLQEEGCVFEIVEPPAVAELLPSLKRISDAWLAQKNAAEKGFSMGFFEPDYIRQCPIALVRREGQIIAFANLWRGADKEELAADLMRYDPGSPHSVIEYLFIQLMLWGKHEGFQWFNLGMAPLSGVDAQRLAPLWNRIAALAYRHGEHFYGFQGLRQYKEKFDPDWAPKYLASPGGICLPVIIANVASLISGGLKGLFAR